MGPVSRSSDLLCVKASLARVSQSGLKTGGARRRVLHVAPSRRLRRSQVEDGRVDAMGCVRPCYTCCAVFTLLGTMGIVVI
jgi:hypothetical protein